MSSEDHSEARCDEIIGESPALKRALALAKSAALSEANVLIRGEAGSGKEAIARAIHRLSVRRSHSFIKVNCNVPVLGQLENELFGRDGDLRSGIGHETGRLQLANNGTLFLDEIADFPLHLQPKLVRLLEHREFEPLGWARTLRVNVRCIATTRSDLAKRVAEREFRRDLHEQLNAFLIRVPSLRERRADIPLLVTYFAHKFARRLNKHIETIPPETMHALQNRDWPGNVRELENLMEQAVVLTEGPTLRTPL
jgi:transcriptional regulator with GAF, ATPase, and Fis domain